jgi:hypothetical protein
MLGVYIDYTVPVNTTSEFPAVTPVRNMYEEREKLSLAEMHPQKTSLEFWSK